MLSAESAGVSSFTIFPPTSRSTGYVPFSSRWSSSSLSSRKRPLMPAWKAFAALVEISLPNRSSVSEKCKLSLRWIVGRSITPSLRTASVLPGSAIPAFFDVHLEEVAHVVERRRGLAEKTLLLDRGGLGVALDHDQAAEHRAVFARHFLPSLFAAMGAE